MAHSRHYGDAHWNAGYLLLPEYEVTIKVTIRELNPIPPGLKIRLTYIRKLCQSTEWLKTSFHVIPEYHETIQNSHTENRIEYKVKSTR